MVTIIWTEKAKSQLEKSVKYIKETQGKFYAEIVLNGIFRQIDSLKKIPRAGQIEPILAYYYFTKL